MPMRHSEKYDALYDDKTFKWLEPKCKDKKCEFCSSRPKNPAVVFSDRIVAERNRPKRI